MAHTTREALQLVLDQVDYTSGACRPNDLVAAALPQEIIAIAKAALSTATQATEGGK